MKQFSQQCESFRSNEEWQISESRRFNSHYIRLSPRRRRRDSRFDDVQMSIMPRTHKRTEASVFLSPPFQQRTQSDVAVFGTANVDSEHICLAMEERSLQGVGSARARAGVVQILCRFIEHTVAITVALSWRRKRAKNDSEIDVKMNGSFRPVVAALFARSLSRFSTSLARPPSLDDIVHVTN